MFDKDHLQDGDSLKADVSDGSVHHHHVCVEHLGAHLHHTEQGHSTRAWRGSTVHGRTAGVHKTTQVKRHEWKHNEDKLTPSVVEVMGIAPHQGNTQPYIKKEEEKYLFAKQHYKNLMFIMLKIHFVKIKHRLRGSNPTRHCNCAATGHTVI